MIETTTDTNELNHEQEHIDNSILEATSSSLNYEELCAAFLCLFYSSGINKTQLEKVLQLSSLLNDQKMPKSFLECSKVLLDKMEDCVKYEKKWFCSRCKKFFILDRQHQRTCAICCEKSV